MNARMSWPWLFAALALCFWLACGAAMLHAHPIAQGSAEVRITPGEITLRARVTTEEVFIASAFSSAANRGNSLLEVWKVHREYLLTHFHLLADGQPLAGRCVANAPPPDGAPPSALAVYDFSYSLPPGIELPQHLRIEEDMLKEFSYAPGNPWTASYVVRVEQPGRGAPIDGLLLDRYQPIEFLCATKASESSETAPAIGLARLWKEYIVHGLLHILTGYDHLLFIGALVLAAKTFWDLVKVVSVFTLAHTFTLTLSVLGVVRLPSQIVEPMIAASIVFVALQNILAPMAARGWTRLVLAFFFGLFHGLGFAGGLLHAMAGLPTLAIAAALAAFSLGVELGHQAVVLPLFGALKFVELRYDLQRGSRFRWLAVRYGSALIACAGAWYLWAALGGLDVSVLSRTER